MTIAGWIIMTVSITWVISLVSFCLYKVFTLPPDVVEGQLHGQPLIDTKDTAD